MVVPVKDEADNVGPLAREIAAALKAEAHEIIFVDDGSTDATAAEMRALKAEIPALRVLRHARNLGQSRSIRTGVMAARGGIIVTLDGDGQNDPADMPKLLACCDPIRAWPWCRACASSARTRPAGGWPRGWAMVFATALLRDGASDTGCGLKAFHRDAFLALPYFDHMHRFLIALTQREGWTCGYVPVNHRPRLAGASKYTNFGRMLVSVHDLLGVRWLQRRHRGRSKTEEL